MAKKTCGSASCIICPDEPRSNTPSLRGLGLRRQPSILSHDRLSLTASSVVGSGMVIVGRDAGGPSLSPQQLGVMGEFTKFQFLFLKYLFT